MKIGYIFLVLGFGLVVWRIDIITQIRLMDETFCLCQRCFIGLGLLCCWSGVVLASYPDIRHWAPFEKWLAWCGGLIASVVVFVILTPGLM
jgi:uncharacterized membrane protein YdcZ (DUF606 family)